MGSHSVSSYPTQVNTPRLNPSYTGLTGWYSIYVPGGMEGWVDLVDLIAPRPGVEPATFRSRVRRRTAAPPRQRPNLYLSSHSRDWRKRSFCHTSAATMPIRPNQLLLLHRRQLSSSRDETAGGRAHNNSWPRQPDGRTAVSIETRATHIAQRLSPRASFDVGDSGSQTDISSPVDHPVGYSFGVFNWLVTSDAGYRAVMTPNIAMCLIAALLSPRWTLRLAGKLFNYRSVIHYALAKYQ